MDSPWAKGAVAGGSGGAVAARPKVLSFALWRSWLRRDAPWRKVRHENPEEEHRAYRAFNRRYLRAVRRAEFRERARARLLRAAALLLAAMLGAGGWLFVMQQSPWSDIETLKHIAAFPNCAAARLVGAAPARVGQPGYYEWHDADRDGMACEPLPGPLPRVHRF